MKKILTLLTIFVVIFSIQSSKASAVDEGLDIRLLESKALFSDINLKVNHHIPQYILQDAQVLIIFPRITKAGFFYAARFGLGVVMVKDEISGKWSTPAFIRISGGSFGLQAGFQQTGIVLVGRNQFTLNGFGDGGPTVGGTASVAAGPFGLHSEIGSGWELNSNMHWFSVNQGLFAGLATEGTVLHYDDNANQTYYGVGVTGQDILYGNKVQPTAVGQMLMDEVNTYETSSFIDMDPSYEDNNMIYTSTDETYSNYSEDYSYSSPTYNSYDNTNYSYQTNKNLHSDNSTSYSQTNNQSWVQKAKYNYQQYKYNTK